MTSDLDIYRSANELIEQHGEAADIEAAMRADECLAAGDMEGEAAWLRIRKAIEELLSEERPDDMEVHYAARVDGPVRRRPHGAGGVAQQHQA